MRIQNIFRSPVFAIPVFLAVSVVTGLSSKAADETKTLGLIVRSIEQSDDDAVRESLMSGMLLGLEGRRNVPAPQNWQTLKEQIEGGKSVKLQEASQRLSAIFGDRDAIENAMVTLRDSFIAIPQRRAALRSLLAQQHKGLSDVLGTLLDVPELQVEAIRGYGVIATDDAAEQILSRYSRLPDAAKRAAIETMATRKAYATALVSGMEKGLVDRKDIPSYVARSMNDLLGKEFTKVYGQIPELNHDVGKTIDKYKRLITEDSLNRASAPRGRIVFQKTCGACHQMYGIGGKVGPDLTGSNRANLDYFLLNSVAPSADVPEGYRTQMVQTEDGRILTGVLAEEDSRRIVLKTVDQPRLIIAKDDIEVRKVSPKSMMPEGQLDQLKPTDLFDLVKYMQTKTQVEAAK